MLFLRFSSSITPRIFLATAYLPVSFLVERKSRPRDSPRGGSHVRLQGAFGGEQPLGDRRLLALKALRRHRHGNRDRVAERILQGDARRADAERMFFAVI